MGREPSTHAESVVSHSRCPAVRALVALSLAFVAACGPSDPRGAGPAGLASTAAALGEPCAGWTCEDLQYAAFDGCDCGCGCWDPDCDDAGQVLYGCGPDEQCAPPGVCEAAAPDPAEPCDAWACDVFTFDAGDGCDCACGCWDPDCDDPLADVVGCAAGESCVAPGDCAADVTCAGWTCAANFYGQLDGCDCACGCWDPDCDDPTALLVGCAGGEVCVPPGLCSEDATCAGWTCDTAFYAAGDGCDCGCGCWDPDCSDPLQALHGCAPGAACVPPSECREASAGGPCAGWTCADASWGALDGCDCDCGCWDPDCDFPDADVRNCTADGACFRPGVCRPADHLVAPCSGWACAGTFFATGDGCDCRCGCWDPDCDVVGGPVASCAAGAACETPGVCETACAAACAGRECGSDGCGGTCGSCAGDLRCTAAGRCEVPCVPACQGRACGFDGCGGSCGACGDGTVCEVGACVPCTPDCAGKACGDDGCRGTCGVCAAGAECSAGRCVDLADSSGDGRTRADTGAGPTCAVGGSPDAPPGAGGSFPSGTSLPLLLLAALALASAARAARRRGA